MFFLLENLGLIEKNEIEKIKNFKISTKFYNNEKS